MSVKNVIKSIALTSIDSSTMSGSYQVINSSGLLNPCSLLRITNGSNMAVTISYDGSTDNDYLADGQVLPIYAQANSQSPNLSALFPIGTKVYVKDSVGTGSVYLAGYYQPNA